METKVIKLDAENVDSKMISEAAAVIDEGGLVVFPTETVYGIGCRVKSDSLARLDDVKGRSADKYYTLHIGRNDDVEKYVPILGLKAKKLIRNAWPGPLTVVFELDRKEIDILRYNFDGEVLKNLYKDRSIGIRCPENLIASMLLQQTKNPVVAPSANIKDLSPAVQADQVLEQLSGKIDLLLDAGPCKYKQSSTVVKIGKKGLEVLRPGFYSKEELDKLSQVKFLFVCTGNTCRSPMAEGIFRKYLAEKLQCNVDDLDKMGYKISSAGIIGSVGYPASPEAVAACAAMGVDIKAHRSKALSGELVEESDIVFAMERIHRDRVIALDSKASDKCWLLADNTGIPDPIGHPQEFYYNCAKLIEGFVQQRVGELKI
ncbi:MAG: threonylcarbamoyl-AMP synthase [Sedimentisphaerales bacterium]|nr:threonylcarbamoyl-AMP synthase [Sedimentisphaerales bacterium]